MGEGREVGRLGRLGRHGRLGRRGGDFLIRAICAIRGEKAERAGRACGGRFSGIIRGETPAATSADVHGRGYIGNASSVSIRVHPWLNPAEPFGSAFIRGPWCRYVVARTDPCFPCIPWAGHRLGGLPVFRVPPPAGAKSIPRRTAFVLDAGKMVATPSGPPRWRKRAVPCLPSPPSFARVRRSSGCCASMSC